MKLILNSNNPQLKNIVFVNIKPIFSDFQNKTNNAFSFYLLSIIL